MRGWWIALAGLAGAGCDTLECGPGTHRSGDECVPNVQVACGEGTVFADGRCVAPLLPDGGLVVDDAGLTCGPGTRRSGNQCVPVGGVFDGGADGAVAADVGPDTDAVAPDAGPDAAAPDMAVPPPACPEGREPGVAPADCGAAVPGTYCVVGVARDFVSGCALPTDANLAVLLIDPIAFVTNPDDPRAYVRGTAAIQAGGVIQVRGQGASQALAIVIDEDPSRPELPDVWVRSVSGVSVGGVDPGQVLPAAVFGTTAETEARWADALGLEAGELQARGFLVGRVLANGPDGRVPVGGATVGAVTVGNLAACAAGQPCLRFFDDEPALTGFRPVGTTTTGASGAFLVHLDDGAAGAYQDRFVVSGTEARYAEITAGASPGRGFHIAFVPQP